MNKGNNSKLTGDAQRLRREMTKEERRLWYGFLKNLPVNVNRQKVIGKYIVDFYIAQSKTVIELDGSQHFEEKAETKDAVRDKFLRERGITVLRYTNLEVAQNFEGVCEDIMRRIKSLPLEGKVSASRRADG